jgi:VCBS repeat-containing protein
MILPAAAASVKLAWNPNPEPNIANYRLSYGTASRSYTQNVDAGTATSVTVSGLEQGKTYYFAVRAINDKGLQSEPSAEVSHYVEIPVPVNQAPVANGQSVSTDEDMAVAITLSASDPDGDGLTYTIVNSPTMGRLSGTAPNLTYTPHADANGNDSFTFRVNDGQADSNTATVSVTIRPVNDAPVAAAQLVTTAEDRPVGILLSATDKDGDPLTYLIVSAPTKGSLSGTAPNLIYTPHPNLHGTDSFSFRANDGTVNSNTATVSITITAVNDAPVAAAQLVTTAADQAVAIALSATDVDGDPLTFRLVSTPIKGRLSGSAPNLTYTPYPDASGSDSFSFRANDGKLDSNTATVSITITAPEKAENAAPVFQSAGISRESGKTDTAYTAASLAGTATDPDGDAVSYAKIAGPEWLLVSADGGLSGTPPQEAAGLNTFTIRASDPQGASADAILEIEIQSGELPLPWTMARIGAIRPDSTASGDGNSITITSSGMLSATQDNQLLTWQTLIGDGEITARVTAIENPANHTLAGVAIRESLAPNSKHTFMGVTPEGGFTMLRRTSTDGQTTRTNSGSGTLPSLWVRLVRKGNIITSFRSTDGSRWTAVSRTNLSLGASCYIGLAVYGGSDELSTGTFDNISITP